jgi:hypothetical protein
MALLMSFMLCLEKSMGLVAHLDIYFFIVWTKGIQGAKNGSLQSFCPTSRIDAKHQLYFWHCLQAIKTWLAILRRRPKFYNVLEAKKEFDLIDADFVPIAQAKDTNLVYFYMFDMFDSLTNSVSN